MKKSIKFYITILLFFLVHVRMAVFAQNTHGPEVVVRTSPEVPAAGEYWTLTILVNHSVPEEVDILAPSFADGLLLNRVAKTMRIMEPDAVSWTSIEYRFILNNPGIITLQPFTVTSPIGLTETAPLAINVRRARESQEPLRPRIIWQGAPSRIAAGENTIFELRVNGWNSALPLPPQEFFMPVVPQGVILETLDISMEEGTAGLALRLRLIPLDAGVFSLPARTLRRENALFEIPALRIQVSAPSPVPAAQGPAAGEQNRADSNAKLDKEPVQFPDFDFAAAGSSALLKTYSADCENIYNTARNLWEQNYRAQALAELRRNERYHPAGALLLPIRREAEQSLGFFNTADENREQRKYLLFVSVVLFLHAMIIPLVCFMFIRSSFWRRGLLLCAIIVAAAGFVFMYRSVNYLGIRHDRNNSGQGRFGVTMNTPVRRAPDNSGEELFIFGEGQPVLVLGSNASWVRVQANEDGGRTGWVPAEAVIFY